MKEKKTEVITFRCTKQLKEQLEEEANKKNWSIAQYVESRLAGIHEEIEEKSLDDAKKIMNYIKTGKCNTLQELYIWAIDNGCHEEVKQAAQIWQDILKELKQ